jgi:hypothetical protein
MTAIQSTRHASIIKYVGVVMVRFALACVALLCFSSFVAAQTGQPVHKCVAEVTR